MGADVIAVGAVVFSCLVGLLGFLIKRAVFQRLDTMEIDLETLRGSTVDVNLCNQAHRNLNETLVGFKQTLEKNTDAIQKMAVDVAVVKTKLERD